MQKQFPLSPVSSLSMILGLQNIYRHKLFYLLKYSEGVLHKVGIFDGRSILGLVVEYSFFDSFSFSSSIFL